MKLPLGLGLIFVLSTLTMAIAVAQTPPAFKLLAFGCVKLDPNQLAVVQFEREVFPSSTVTDLIIEEAPRLLYVEGGRLTIFSDQAGQMLAAAGDSFLAPPGSALGVRNDGSADASLLWLRLTDPFNAARSSRFADPRVIHVLRAIARRDMQGPQPILAEIELPQDSLKHGDNSLTSGHLFMAQLDFGPLAVDPVDDGLAPISSGAAAIVVESGELTVNELASQPLLAGQATLVAKDAYFVENSGGEPARAYLIGIVGEDDRGQVGLAIERVQGRQHACFP